VSPFFNVYKLILEYLFSGNMSRGRKDII